MTDPRQEPKAHGAVDLGAALARAEPLTALLPALQDAARAQDQVCLVGGAVRDLLLGSKHLDVDLAVEGDSLAFARRLAELLEGELVVHERFQTATVRTAVADSDVEVDVAATRSERYETPGALPQVEPADLRSDLRRRDFTVNAMAVSLRRDDFGALHDPFDGQGDLRAGLIRILAEHSFEDDPTRLLRALRYGARLGFSIEPHTLELARAACASGLIGRMASGRVRDELLDLLAEPSNVEALRTMSDLQLDSALHPSLRVDERACALSERLPQAASAAGVEERCDLVLARLASLCLQFESEQLVEWLDRLQLTATERAAVVDAATRASQLGIDLAAWDGRSRSRLRTLLAGRPAETVALAVACEPATATAAALYVEQVERVRLEISGDDLLAEGIDPGPELGRVLRETLNLKLDGQVSGRDQELAAALDLLRAGSQ